MGKNVPKSIEKLSNRNILPLYIAQNIALIYVVLQIAKVEKKIAN